MICSGFKILIQVIRSCRNSVDILSSSIAVDIRRVLAHSLFQRVPSLTTNFDFPLIEMFRCAVGLTSPLSSKAHNSHYHSRILRPSAYAHDTTTYPSR